MSLNIAVIGAGPGGAKPLPLGVRQDEGHPWERGKVGNPSAVQRGISTPKGF